MTTNINATKLHFFVATKLHWEKQGENKTKFQGIEMISSRKILQILLVVMTTIAFGNCQSEKKDDQTPLLAILALANQSPFTGFTNATLSGFTAFVSSSAQGTPEDKVGVTGLERKTSMDLTYNFTSTAGEIRLYAAVDTQFRAYDNDGTYLRITPTGLTGFVRGTQIAGTSGNVAAFVVAPGNSRSICVDIHREIEGTAITSAKVKFHFIAWNRPCAQLTNTDRQATGYVWDRETEILDPIANVTNAARFADELFAGFAFNSGAVVTSIRPSTPFALGGIILQ